VRTCLIECLTCSNHGGEESLLPPLCSSYDDLSLCDSILLPLLCSDGGALLLLRCEAGGGDGADASHGQGGGGDWGGWCCMMVGPRARVRLEMSRSKKIDDSD
jgi:hypothetical protein